METLPTELEKQHHKEEHSPKTQQTDLKQPPKDDEPAQQDSINPDLIVRHPIYTVHTASQRSPEQ
jgi:hypothetical protein